jgi:hypothetical protein
MSQDSWDDLINPELRIIGAAMFLAKERDELFSLDVDRSAFSEEGRTIWSLIESKRNLGEEITPETILGTLAQMKDKAAYEQAYRALEFGHGCTSMPHWVSELHRIYEEQMGWAG